jgi:hypothetical protein
MIQVDMALWLRSSSPEPDLIEMREIDPCLTARDAVLALMQEHKETYVYKAAVGMPYGIQRLWHVSLALPDCQVSALDIVKSLWPLLVADGVDPVDIFSWDALDLVRAFASDDPADLFARWSCSALAADLRVFADIWNSRRASEVQHRLLFAEEESEVPYGNIA